MEGRDRKKGFYLDHRPPRTLLVLQLGLTTNTDDIGVVHRGSDEPVE